MDKMGITSGQRTMCLEMLQQMAYATSRTVIQLYAHNFVAVHHQLWSIMSMQIGIPFIKQWVMGMKYSTGTS